MKNKFNTIFTILLIVIAVVYENNRIDNKWDNIYVNKISGIVDSTFLNGKEELIVLCENSNISVCLGRDYNVKIGDSIFKDSNSYYYKWYRKDSLIKTINLYK